MGWWSLVVRIDALLAALADPTHVVRFALALANFVMFVSIAIASRGRADNPRWPNGAFSIPLAGLMAGLMGYDAISLFGFVPFDNYRVFLNLVIASCLALLLAMLALRWRGYDL